MDVPHACSGHGFLASWEGDLDTGALVAAVEGALPELDCTGRTGSLTCMPADEPCGWELDDVASREVRFLDVLADFDARFENYGFSVIESCVCRVY